MQEIANNIKQNTKMEIIKWNTHPTITKKLYLLYVIFKKNNITFDFYLNIVEKCLSLYTVYAKNNTDNGLLDMVYYGVADSFLTYDPALNPYLYSKKLFPYIGNRRGLRNKKLYRYMGKPVKYKECGNQMK